MAEQQAKVVYLVDENKESILIPKGDSRAVLHKPNNTYESVNQTSVALELDKLATLVGGHKADTANPHGVTKGQVGLGNVVNTGDSATPVANGTTKFTTGGAYTELAKKADKTITVNGHALSANVIVTKADVGLGNVDNTADSAKSVASAAKATKDSLGQQIDSTYIKEISASGKTLTIKRGDGTTATVTTQDTITTIDSALSATSTNPVQNKVVKAALDGKAASSHTHAGSAINHTPGNSYESATQTTVSAELDKLMGLLKGKSVADLLTALSNADGGLSLTVADVVKTIATLNAHTVDGYHAGASAGMLCPIVACNFGSSSGYVKWGNGLIVQWGTIADGANATGTVSFPIQGLFTAKPFVFTTGYSLLSDYDNMNIMCRASKVTINDFYYHKWYKGDPVNTILGFRWLAIGI